MIRLHNKISDLLKLRLNYDLYNILIPLAIGSGFHIQSLERIKEKRSNLMNSTFYKYASSSNPTIDSHLVYTTLDLLCWYWILIEFLFLGFITLIIILFSTNILIIKLLIIIDIFLFCFIKILKKSCIDKTNNEINAILSDRTRKQDIKQEYTDIL